MKGCSLLRVHGMLQRAYKGIHQQQSQSQLQQPLKTSRRLDINTAPVSKRYVQTKQAEEHLASLDDAGDMRAAVSLYLDALQWLLQHQLDLLADRYGLDSVSQQEHVSHPVDRRVGSLGAYVRKVTGHLWAMQLLRLRALEPDVHETMVKAFCTRQNIVLQSSVFGKTRQRLVAGRHQGGDDGDGGDDQEGSAAGSAQNMPTRAFMDRLSNANAVLRVCCVGSIMQHDVLVQTRTHTIAHACRELHHHPADTMYTRNPHILHILTHQDHTTTTGVCRLYTSPCYAHHCVAFL